ncbi:hypothetical protein CEXT_618171 [Caerostris extrusa]|uniref:Uncharacterized protein n=1 Tax=Caerostris extrusa TaxID=172846 RepID=A0AAV4MLN0_CAEEX|nr:hypothetical protein CEXT_618171 [Caerostris extrusa]
MVHRFSMMPTSAGAATHHRSGNLFGQTVMQHFHGPQGLFSDAACHCIMYFTVAPLINVPEIQPSAPISPHETPAWQTQLYDHVFASLHIR